MVVIGGEGNSDLKDFWALDLEEMMWFKPEINFVDHYSAKRFHSVCQINQTQVITFGGCHSEYVHMNEMHIFDLAQFLQTPNQPESRVQCKKIDVKEGVPSTRWGHAASTFNGKLFIVGGRNEQDVIDMHEFDPVTMKWREIEFNGVLPKPRRRHSALFVSNSLVMFGGFDGNFFNDLNIVDLNQTTKSQVIVSQTSITQDYLKMVDC